MSSQILTPKFDWYQTDANVVLTVMVKKVNAQELNVKYEEQAVTVNIDRENGEKYSLRISLSRKVIPEKCSERIMSTKIECKLVKEEGIWWSALQGEDDSPATKMAAAPTTEDSHKYPSSAHYTRDWDKLVSDIKQEEQNEKPEGEEALNNLFQKIYKDGDDNLRKAMNKSFQESGGTVLSTNWGDIEKGKTDIKPPDGMEYKKYEL